VEAGDTMEFTRAYGGIVSQSSKAATAAEEDNGEQVFPLSLLIRMHSFALHSVSDHASLSLILHYELLRGDSPWS
jgi:hypothetical protein